MHPAVLLDIEGAQARVTLSHPGKFNAMSRAMWRRLREVFVALQARPDLRCVLVQGQDGHFCAGGDIAEYPGFRFDEAELRQFHEQEVWGALQAMLDCDLPLVAVIDGNCMGAGLEIASCCDLRLATQRARFGAPIARLGFPMAPREMALLLREAGALTLRQMLLGAAVLDASTLAARGFLSQVLEAQALAAAAQDVADQLARLAPQAARLNKRGLRQAQPLAPVGDAALAEAFHYADSAEHREGIEAFLAKRAPVF